MIYGWAGYVENAEKKKKKKNKLLNNVILQVRAAIEGICNYFGYLNDMNIIKVG